MVDVILLERVEKLGQMGQIVKVKPGFARNYLLPQKKAMRATKENMAYFETQRAQLEANNLQRKSEAGDVSTKLEGLTVVLIRQAGESGQLYGSVMARERAGGLIETPLSRNARERGCARAAICQILARHAARLGLPPGHPHRPAESHRRGRQDSRLRGLARACGDDPPA